jgi:hypothetical protein
MQDDVTILKTDKKPLEGVEQLKYFGANLTDENSIQE